MDSVCENMANFRSWLHELRVGIGRGIELFGRRGSSSSQIYIREGIGRCIDIILCREPPIVIDSYPGPQPSKHWLFFVSGLGISLQEGLEQAKEVQAIYSGHLLFYMVHPTKGYYEDIREAAKLRMLRRPTKAIMELALKLAQLARSDPHPEQPGEVTIDVIAFSRGALYTDIARDQLSKDVQRRIVIHTLGSPRMIPQDS